MLNQNHLNAMDINEVFQPFVTKVLETRTFGVSRRAIQLNYVTSSGRQKADRFNFSIPYAGQTLQWTVIFDSNCPELGPDFEFNDDAFLSDPDPDTIRTQIPSLAHWISIAPESLLNVLLELISCYKQHQMELLGRNEQRLYGEYKMLLDRTDVSSSDVELMLIPEVGMPNEIKFMIRLVLDFSKLPGRSNKNIDDGAMIIITFQQPKWSRVIPELYLTTTLEKTLGGSGTLHIPPFPRDKFIMDYIQDVKKLISDKIHTVASGYEERKNFIATLLFLQRRNVVEYDASNFHRITILLEHQDFFFLLHFHLAPEFPTVQPEVYLQSIYHTTSKDELVKTQIQHYPYSPRWQSARMITTILKTIVSDEIIEKFKKTSVNRS